MTETGVSASFSAAHRERGQQHWHGHTWTVRAWVKDEGHDARQVQAKLRLVLAPLDHVELPAHLSSGEQIAVFVARCLGNCTEVEVSRQAEGIFARWRP